MKAGKNVYADGRFCFELEKIDPCVLAEIIWKKLDMKVCVDTLIDTNNGTIRVLNNRKYIHFLEFFILVESILIHKNSVGANT